MISVTLVGATILCRSSDYSQLVLRNIFIILPFFVLVQQVEVDYVGHFRFNGICTIFQHFHELVAIKTFFCALVFLSMGNAYDFPLPA